MPETVLTSLAILGALGAMFRPLKNGFYIFHIALVAGGAWLVQRYTGDAAMFSPRAVKVFLALHLPIINAITYLAYAVDKRAAIRGAWRVPERQLQALALVGGTPGAALAQKILRHKTKKQSFRVIFWFIVAIQLGALAVLALR